jgi:hypothetical protein
VNLRHCLLIPAASLSIYSMPLCAIAGPLHPLPAPASEVRHLGDLAGGGNGQANLSPTPEPGTLVLFGSGLLVLGGAIRRYNKKKIDQQAQIQPRAITAENATDLNASVTSGGPC